MFGQLSLDRKPMFLSRYCFDWISIQCQFLHSNYIYFINVNRKIENNPPCKTGSSNIIRSVCDIADFLCRDTNVSIHMWRATTCYNICVCVWHVNHNPYHPDYHDIPRSFNGCLYPTYIDLQATATDQWVYTPLLARRVLSGLTHRIPLLAWCQTPRGYLWLW